MKPIQNSPSEIDSAIEEHLLSLGPDHSIWKRYRPAFLAALFWRRTKEELQKNRDLRRWMGYYKSELERYQGRGTLARILRSKMHIDLFCGIYFLLKDEEVVYVGQSTNVFGRMNGHKDKDFDHVSFIPCAIEDLDVEEARYIQEFNPKYNRMKPSFPALQMMRRLRQTS